MPIWYKRNAAYFVVHVLTFGVDRNIFEWARKRICNKGKLISLRDMGDVLMIFVPGGLVKIVG